LLSGRLRNNSARCPRSARRAQATKQFKCGVGVPRIDFEIPEQRLEPALLSKLTLIEVSVWRHNYCTPRFAK
jgi:hypothetical protein